MGLPGGKTDHVRQEKLLAHHPIGVTPQFLEENPLMSGMLIHQDQAVRPGKNQEGLSRLTEIGETGENDFCW